MESCLCKKNVFFGIFYHNLGPSKFYFCLGKQPNSGQTIDAREKVKKENVAWDIANNRYVDRILQTNFLSHFFLLLIRKKKLQIFLLFLLYIFFYGT